MGRAAWTVTAEAELSDIAYWIAVEDGRPRTARKIVQSLLLHANAIIPLAVDIVFCVA